MNNLYYIMPSDKIYLKPGIRIYVDGQNTLVTLENKRCIYGKPYSRYYVDFDRMLDYVLDKCTSTYVEMQYSYRSVSIYSVSKKIYLGTLSGITKKSNGEVKVVNNRLGCIAKEVDGSINVIHIDEMDSRISIAEAPPTLEVYNEEFDMLINISLDMITIDYDPYRSLDL